MVPAMYQDSSITKHWDNHKGSINLTEYLFWIQFKVVDPIFNKTSCAVYNFRCGYAECTQLRLTSDPPIVDLSVLRMYWKV